MAPGDFPADLQCKTFEDPSELPDCNDGIDDDGDGLVDHPADPGCGSPTSLLEAPACNDGVDNDGDGKIDLDGGPGGGTPDPRCAGGPAVAKENATSSCGLGAEVPFALAAIRLLRNARRRRRAT